MTDWDGARPAGGGSLPRRRGAARRRLGRAAAPADADGQRSVGGRALPADAGRRRAASGSGAPPSAGARATRTRRPGAGAGRSARSRRSCSPATGPRAEEAARWALDEGAGEAESPIGRYAAALACSVLGDWEHARVHADTIRIRDDFPRDVGDALATIAAEDVVGYVEAVESVLESFETRDDVPRGRAGRGHGARAPGARGAARHGGRSVVCSFCREVLTLRKCGRRRRQAAKRSGAAQSPRIDPGGRAAAAPRPAVAGEGEVGLLPEVAQSRRRRRGRAARSCAAPRTRLAGVAGEGGSAKARSTASAFASPVTR